LSLEDHQAAFRFHAYTINESTVATKVAGDNYLQALFNGTKEKDKDLLRAASYANHARLQNPFAYNNYRSSRSSSSTSGSSDSPPGPRGPRKPTPANWRDLLTGEELTFITQTTAERIADRKARREAQNQNQDNPQAQAVAPNPNRPIKVLESAGREDYPDYEGGSSAGWRKDLPAKDVAFLIKCDIGRLIGLYQLSEPDEKPKPAPATSAAYTGPAVIGKITPTTLTAPITPTAPLAPASSADPVSAPTSAAPETITDPTATTSPCLDLAIWPFGNLAISPPDTAATPPPTEPPAERPAPTEAEFQALEAKLGTTIGRSANIHDPKEVARLTEHAEYCANQKRRAKIWDEFVERTSPYKWPRGP
jgi:hypothetical protein